MMMPLLHPAARFVNQHVACSSPSTGLTSNVSSSTTSKPIQILHYNLFSLLQDLLTGIGLVVYSTVCQGINGLRLAYLYKNDKSDIAAQFLRSFRQLINEFFSQRRILETQLVQTPTYFPVFLCIVSIITCLLFSFQLTDQGTAPDQCQGPENFQKRITRIKLSIVDTDHCVHASWIFQPGLHL